MEPIRIGVLGAARISGRAIATPAQSMDARLTVVAARDRGRAEKFATAHGVERVADSYLDVITADDVDAIYNPLANGLHAPWNLAAIRAGKHVLSEKPFASNAEEAAEVRDAAAEAGVVVAEAFHYRYHPVIQRLLEVVAAGEIGEVQQVNAIVRTSAPEPDDPRWSLELAGGALMDLGCYGLHIHRSLAPWLGGEPVLTEAEGGTNASGVDEWANANLTFPSGAEGRVFCGMSDTSSRSTRDMTFRITGTRGAVSCGNFVLPHLDNRLFVETEGSGRVEEPGTRPSYSYQLEAFLAWVRGGEPMPTDADDAVATMQLIDGCYQMIGLEPRPRYDGPLSPSEQ